MRNIKDVLRLKLDARLSHEQIAAALDCAPTSVRVLLHRGIATLKETVR